MDPIEPRTLTLAEWRDAIISIVSSGQSFYWGEPSHAYATIDSEVNDRNSGSAKLRRWNELNRDRNPIIARALFELSTAGLIRRTDEHWLSGQPFVSTDIRPIGTTTSVMPPDLNIVWEEAHLCFPLRPRATAILLGVCAEVATLRFAEKLSSTSAVPSAAATKLKRAKISEARQGCIDTLTDDSWQQQNEVSEERVRSAIDCLEHLGKLYASVRNDAAHFRTDKPPSLEVLQVLIAAVPYYVSILDALP
jgi:hypothetical protein